MHIYNIKDDVSGSQIRTGVSLKLVGGQYASFRSGGYLVAEMLKSSIRKDTQGVP